MNNLKDIIKAKDTHLTSNSFTSFVYRRVEKITTAIYLVTDFLLDKEPLKFVLREKNIKLMSEITSLEKERVSFKKDTFGSIDLLIREINSSLKIALTIKLISEMNYSILASELRKVLNLIGEESKKEKEILSLNFFEQEEYSLEEKKGVLFKGQLDKGQFLSKGQKSEVYSKGHFSFDNKKENVSSVPLKKNVLNKRNVTKKDNVKSSLKNSIKKERQNKILKIIKDTGEVTIKDIVKKIHNCSEKTIQRDLASLLKNNVLKKKGERRWSFYFLNSLKK